MSAPDARGRAESDVVTWGSEKHLMARPAPLQERAILRPPMPAEPEPPTRFSQFGRYLLLDRLAMGGMAEVHLAKQFFETGGVTNLLAMKRIRPSLAEQNAFIRMFLDEAKIAGRLTHPGIVRIHEVGRVGESHYLAMDFVWGKDLLAIMRRAAALGTRLSCALVAYIGSEMCEALHAAHSATDRQGVPMQVIHRDVSPQNILVSFDGQVRIIDFGIAKAQARLTQTQTGLLKGKINYMSPEQVVGHDIDQRSDLFAVGVCLYELLTLRTLFARATHFETMEAVRHVDARPIQTLRSDIPDTLSEIVHRALSREADRRYQSAAQLRDALQSFLHQTDPAFDRSLVATWMRDVFRKEFSAERRRLHALDQVGRPQLTRLDERPRHSVTDLELSTGRPPAPEWDEDARDGEILVPPADLSEPPPPRDGPAEVYFSQPDMPAVTSLPSTPLGVAVRDDEAETDPDQALQRGFADATDPPRVSDDIAFDPAHVHSGMIAALAPPPQESTDVRRQVAQQPTDRYRAVRPDSIRPPSAAAGTEPNWGRRVAIGLLLVILGGLGSMGIGRLTATAQVEVRTTPSVGAVVLLDGASQGPAPVRLENVDPGRHVITVVAPGYADVTRSVYLEADRTTQLDVILEAAHRDRSAP